MNKQRIDDGCYRKNEDNTKKMSSKMKVEQRWKKKKKRLWNFLTTK